ncbi:MAG: serine acetyltransferase [Deltaproteobacteria bacterium]|nr:serine acetyltransferase [Deltaproteobacteria bacterium]
MTASSSPPIGGIQPLVDALLASYRTDGRAHHINKRYLPSRDEAIAIVQLLLQLMYPGYFGRQDLTDENVGYHVGVLLSTVSEKLERQIELCLCYRDEAVAERADVTVCRSEGRGLAREFLDRLPALRALLLEDVQAAYDGDPAALNADEIILAYPGLLAVTVYRIAHELHQLGVPMMPRIMTEWAHTHTGADIHPGATIGRAFFLDHATGAVIGETTVIGDRVKLYQGVTLGALSIARDERGRVIRGTKRHPTVEDDVTIYANATVLGGKTTVGRAALVGGGVFLTRTVPPGARVAGKATDVEVQGHHTTVDPTDPDIWSGGGV